MKQVLDSALVAFGLVLAVVMSISLLNPFGSPVLRGAAGQSVNRQVQHLKERLNLRGDQEKQVRQILLDSAQQMGRFRRKYSGDESLSREAIETIRKIREQTGARLMRVLDVQQAEEYDRLMQERRRGGDDRPERGGRLVAGKALAV